MSGVESGANMDGVIQIEGRHPTHPSLCTGTLIAPNLIVTALHCVAELDERDGFACDIRGHLDNSIGSGGYLGAAFDPSIVRVYSGAVPDTEPAAEVVEILAPFTENICQNDIALLLLDRALALPFLPVRLDSPTHVGEMMTVVGYGMNELDLLARRERSGNAVIAVGPSEVNPNHSGSAPRTFMLGAGACKGDSGGPALSDETSAAVGVFSIIGDACGSASALTTYTQIAPYQELVRAAFEQAGYEPLLEDVPDDPDSARSSAGCQFAASRSTGEPLGWASAAALMLLLRRQRWSRGVPASNT